MRRLVPFSFALLLGLCLGACSDSDSAERPTCVTPLAPDEPPCSIGYAEGAWPGSHRGGYAQASSPLPGPDTDVGVVAKNLGLSGTPITLATSPPYADGGYLLWAPLLSFDGAVSLIDPDDFSIVDTYVPAERETDPPTYDLGISGAYALVDAYGRFVVGRSRSVEIFESGYPDSRDEEIRLHSRITLPESFFCDVDDYVTGMVAAADGSLALVTEGGRVGVVPRSPSGDLRPGHLAVASADDACTADGETVSNNPASDEEGGIYIVTSAAMYRFDWTDDELSRAWRVEYPVDQDMSGIRLGEGSGSTPTLMGTAGDDDRFVVITDGRSLMNLLFIHRDGLPAGATPLRPGLDARVACEIPIRFGDAMATESSSEQSVLVRGYSAVVVNNELVSPDTIPPFPPGVPSSLDPARFALYGGDPAHAPHGLERVDWDPAMGTCQSVWANPTVSIPNGIPTMSAATNLIYGIGLSGGLFGLMAVDFDDGMEAFFVPGEVTACQPELYDRMGSLVTSVIMPFIEALPQSCENSIYAATEVGPDGSIYTGTFYGASRYQPGTAPAGFDDAAKEAAGVEQSRDWLRRHMGRADSARELGDLGRAGRQIEATMAVAAAANGAALQQAKDLVDEAAADEGRRAAACAEALSILDTLAAAP